MDIQKLGNTIATCRQDRKMTQEEFASRLGVTSQAVSKWETGLGCPDITLIEGICKILKISPEVLFEIGCGEEFREQEGDQLFDQALNWLCSEPLELLVGRSLIEAVTAGLKTDIIHRTRQEAAKEQGVLLPRIRIRDEMTLGRTEFCVRSYGKELIREQADAAREGCFADMLKRTADAAGENYAAILNRDMVYTLVENVRKKHPAVVEGTVPEKISLWFLQKVLKGLLEQGCGIRNLVKIIETAEECIEDKTNISPEEVVRELMAKGV